MRDEIVDEVWVCTNCMLDHANGEIDPDRPADLPEVWSLIRFGYSVTMGGTHADGCPNGPDGPRDTDCDCEYDSFMTSACEGCGDSHHGERFRFTLWRATLSTARQEHRACIRRAHDSADHLDRIAHLATAADWRTYLRRRFAEERTVRAVLARSVA